MLTTERLKSIDGWRLDRIVVDAAKKKDVVILIYQKDIAGVPCWLKLPIPTSASADSVIEDLRVAAASLGEPVSRA